MRFFYDLGILLWSLFQVPKLLRRGKGSMIRARLGREINIPELSGQVIWVHAVSLGETKASRPLLKRIKEAHPEASIVFSTATDTGQGEAKKIPEVDYAFYLPLDLSWIMRRLVRKIRPEVLILVESDFWLNLMREVKRVGGKCVLVNGKMSQRSYMRLNRFRAFARSLFAPIDLFCMQNDLYRTRFEALGIATERLFSTGNLKFDIERGKLSEQGEEAFRRQLGLEGDDPVVVVSCTHNKEEALILPQLELLWERFPKMRVLLAPRHPARFDGVAELIEGAGIGFVRYSQQVPMGEARLMLIDAIGVLDPCYQVADVVLMGGSFVPKIGGHNIFEPLEGSVCLFFGPHMHTQEELVALVLEADAGEQIDGGQIAERIANCLSHSDRQESLLENSRTLIESVRGGTERCFKKIEKVVVG